MTQTIFRRLLLLTLLLVMTTPFPAAAEEGQIYTIKKGDTLWGLSQRFINDPYYWPDLWADNPSITNPHLIFPGQKIRIHDGRLEIIPAYPEAKPQVQEPVAEQKAEEVQPEAIQIKSAGGSEGFIRTSEVSLGTLVDSVDNRILLTKGDQVFLKMAAGNDATVGDTYGLYKEGDEIKDPQTGKKIGTMMNNLGFLQVTGHTGDTVDAKIGDVFREVERGAELFEYVPPRMELTLKHSNVELNGSIVATRDEKLTISTNDIIFIDLGSEDGLESGNLFYISRHRQASDEMLKKAGNITLPDAVLGAAVVIEAHAKTASALVIKSADAMFVGDQITVTAQ